MRRYTMETSLFRDDDNGVWVKFSDVQAALSALKKDARELATVIKSIKYSGGLEAIADRILEATKEVEDEK